MEYRPENNTEETPTEQGLENLSVKNEQEVALEEARAEGITEGRRQAFVEAANSFQHLANNKFGAAQGYLDIVLMQENLSEAVQIAADEAQKSTTEGLEETAKLTQAMRSENIQVKTQAGMTIVDIDKTLNSPTGSTE